MEKRKKKNLIWMIVCIVMCVIFVPIIIFNLILSIKGAKNKDELPSLFGIAPTAVTSGSMSPKFEVKDLIFIKDVDASKLEEEDIICFLKDGSFITHRIVRIEEVEGVLHFITKGDANNVEDSGFVLAEQIQGKYVGRMAGFGGLIMFLQTPSGLIVVVILLVVLYIAGELLIEWLSAKKENKALKEENARLK